LGDLSLTVDPNKLVIKNVKSTNVVNTIINHDHLWANINSQQMSVGLTTKGCIYLEETIVDINVIVPNKVVEITFGDDKKEKMICHKNDAFDLRRCCFIAIAKHLYKEEYTFEGIEYVAEQLMYQKKYVKIVSDALKDH